MSSQPRYTFYINEPQYLVTILQQLLNNHVVLQNSALPTKQRLIPNPAAKSVAMLMLQYVATHNNLSQLKLKEFAVNSNLLPPSSTQRNDHNNNQQNIDQHSDSASDTDDEVLVHMQQQQKQQQQQQQQQQLQSQKQEPTVETAKQPTLTPVVTTITTTTTTTPATATTATTATASKLSPFRCQVCSIDFPNVMQFRVHMRSPEHTKMLRTQSKGAQLAPATTTTATTTQPIKPNITPPSNTQPESEKNTEQINTVEQPESQQSIIQPILPATFQPPTTATPTVQTQQPIVRKVVTFTESQHAHGALDYTYDPNTSDDDDLYPGEVRLTKKQKKQLQKQQKLDAQEQQEKQQQQQQQNKSKQHDHHNNTETVTSLSSNTNNNNTNSGNNNNNNNNDNLSNKVGSAIQFLLIPATKSTNNNNTQNSEQDDDKSSPHLTKQQRNARKNDPSRITLVNNNNTEPLYISLTKQHVIQNLIICSATLQDSIFIPPHAASFNALANVAAENQQYNVNANVNNNNNSNNNEEDDDITSPSNPHNIYMQFIKATFNLFFSSLTAFPRLMPYTNPSLTAIIMDSGGKFALSIFHGHSIIIHKSVANYTTRKKQGKQQAVHDKEGGRAKSVGSSIRRQQTLRHKERIREVLYHLRAELFACSQILLYIPSPVMREQFFMSKEQLVKWGNTGGQYIGHTDIPMNIIYNNTNNNNNNQQQQTINNQTTDYTYFNIMNEQYQTLHNNQQPLTIPQTQELSIPNMNYYLRQKYPVLFDAGHNYNINKERPSVYQLSYINKKKNNPNQKNKKDNNNNNNNTGEELFASTNDTTTKTNHNITEDWHRDTLIYHMQMNIPQNQNQNQNQSNNNNNNINGGSNNNSGDYEYSQYQQQKNNNTNTTSLIDAFSEHMMSVDTFVGTQTHNNTIHNPIYTIEPLNPPIFANSLYIPSQKSLTTPNNNNTKLQQQQSQQKNNNTNNTMMMPNENSNTTNNSNNNKNTMRTINTNNLTSNYNLPLTNTTKQYEFLENSLYQPTKHNVVNYSIKPYHPHFWFCNNTPQNEHLFLLHPNDPRIVNIGWNIHDAKHHEIIRLYSHLMRFKQQTTTANTTPSSPTLPAASTTTATVASTTTPPSNHNNNNNNNNQHHHHHKAHNNKKKHGKYDNDDNNNDTNDEDINSSWITTSAIQSQELTIQPSQQQQDRQIQQNGQHHNDDDDDVAWDVSDDDIIFDDDGYDDTDDDYSDEYHP